MSKTLFQEWTNFYSTLTAQNDFEMEDESIFCLESAFYGGCLTVFNQFISLKGKESEGAEIVKKMHDELQKFIVERLGEGEGG